MDTSTLDQATENLAHNPRSNLEDAMRVLKACQRELDKKAALPVPSDAKGCRVRVRNLDSDDIIYGEIL